MELVGIIIAVSTVIWFVIDRFSTLFKWKELKYGNWITTGIACGLSTIAVCTFNLDLLVACKVVTDVTFFGCLMTVLCMCGGSSCIAEIIKRIKGDGVA